MMGKARWIAAGGATVLIAALAVPGMTRQAQQSGLAETPAAATPPALAAVQALEVTPTPVSATSGAEVKVGTETVSPDPTEATAPKPKDEPRDPNVGSVTNLPLPRFVSLKGNEGNARRGPGLTHRIDWVFKASGMPLQITAEYEHWRRVQDAEGVGGWVNFVLLSGVRTAEVTQDMAEFRSSPQPDADVVFQTEMGVIGKLLECTLDWCRMNVQGEKGWVQKTALWGVEPDEILE